jgi:hypothetical protein
MSSAWTPVPGLGLDPGNSSSKTSSEAWRTCARQAPRPRPPVPSSQPPSTGGTGRSTEPSAPPGRLFGDGPDGVDEPPGHLPDLLAGGGALGGHGPDGQDPALGQACSGGRW